MSNSHSTRKTAPTPPPGPRPPRRCTAPPRGAYIPFSEGYRACLGRRFAQAEILAVLAVIFKSHSVELCTDTYASESEVEAMQEAERREVWGKAKRDVEEKLRKDMGMVFSMQLRGKEGVKVRVCRRGEERFDY